MLFILLIFILTKFSKKLFFMKKLFFLLFIFVPLALYSQTVSEKLINKFTQLGETDAYSIKYDVKSGTYVYAVYDTTKIVKNSIISNKGNSGDYDFVNNFATIFDSDGNYYVVVSQNLTDTTSKNTFLKNGKEIATYDYINSEIWESNGNVFLMCTNNGKSFIAKYNIGGGNLIKGKEYDEILLCDFEKNVYEGEPMAKLGFTKDGKPFYIAKSNSKSFMVIEEEEQMPYSDIDAYTVVQDKNGKLAYVAKDTGSILNPGGAFVVYGNTKYNTANNIYNLLFDNEGNVVYLATDFTTNEDYPQKIMKGNKAISKTYLGGINYLNITPEGKIYFTASEKKNAEEYVYYFVYNGKEHKAYISVLNPKVYSGDKFVYTAQIEDERYAIVNGADEIKLGKKQYVQSADLLENGSLAYVVVEYGDYDRKIKDKYSISINDKKSGPFDGMQMLDYEKNSFVISDKSGNYAYMINNIKNFTDYSYILHTNNGKSEEFDLITDVKLIKGKAFFVASKFADKDKYTYKYKAYYNNKPVSIEYDSYSELNFNEITNTISFIGSKGNEIYRIEIKF